MNRTAPTVKPKIDPIQAGASALAPLQGAVILGRGSGGSALLHHRLNSCEPPALWITTELRESGQAWGGSVWLHHRLNSCVPPALRITTELRERERAWAWAWGGSALLHRWLISCELPALWITTELRESGWACNGSALLHQRLISCEPPALCLFSGLVNRGPGAGACMSRNVVLVAVSVSTLGAEESMGPVSRRLKRAIAGGGAKRNHREWAYQIVAP